MVLLSFREPKLLNNMVQSTSIIAFSSFSSFPTIFTAIYNQQSTEGNDPNKNSTSDLSTKCRNATSKKTKDDSLDFKENAKYVLVLYVDLAR